MKAILEINIPRICSDCPLITKVGDCYAWRCIITGNSIEDYPNDNSERHPDCPLKIVPE